MHKSTVSNGSVHPCLPSSYSTCKTQSMCYLLHEAMRPAHDFLQALRLLHRPLWSIHHIEVLFPWIFPKILSFLGARFVPVLSLEPCVQLRLYPLNVSEWMMTHPPLSSSRVQPHCEAGKACYRNGEGDRGQDGDTGTPKPPASHGHTKPTGTPQR